MYFVYVLRSRPDCTLYVGITNNLTRRRQEHNRGRQRSTKAKRPFTLLLSESFETRQAARAREKYHKSGFGREIVKATFAG